MPLKTVPVEEYIKSDHYRLGGVNLPPQDIYNVAVRNTGIPKEAQKSFFDARKRNIEMLQAGKREDSLLDLSKPIQQQPLSQVGGGMERQEEQKPQDKGFIGSLVEKAETRADEISRFRREYEAGNRSLGQYTRRVLGQGLGLVGDIGGEAVVRGAKAVGDVTGLTEPVVAGAKAVAGSGAGQAIGDVFQKYGVENWQELKKNYPQVAEDIENVGNVAAGVTTFWGGGIAGKGAQKGAQATAQGARATEKAIRGVGTKGALGTKNAISGASDDALINIADKVDELRASDTVDVEELDSALKAALKGEVPEVKLNTKVTSADDIAAKYGIELTPGMTGSDLVNRIEGLVNESLGAALTGGGTKRKVENAIAKFETLLEDTAGKAISKEELGNRVASAFETAKKAERDMVTSLYEKARQNSVPVLVTPKETVKKLDEMIEQWGKSGLEDDFVAKLRTIKKKVEDPDTTTDVIESIRKSIGGEAGFDKMDNMRSPKEKSLAALYMTLDEDATAAMGKLPAMSQSIKEAKAQFAKMKELEKRTFYKDIEGKLEKKQFDRVADAVTNPNMSINDIMDMYKFLGDETTQEIRTSVVRNIIEKARSKGEGFTPTGISGQLKAIGDEKMNVIFDEGQRQFLKDVAVLSRAISRGEAVTKGSQTAILGNIQKALSGAFALGTSGLSLIGEIGLSKLFTTERFQNFLKGLSKTDATKAKEIQQEFFDLMTYQQAQKMKETATPDEKLFVDRLLKPLEGVLSRADKTVQKYGKKAEEYAKNIRPGMNIQDVNTMTPAQKKSAGVGVDKQAQLEKINKLNPMTDDYHTGIRKVDDIKTFKEAIEDPESFVYPDFDIKKAEQSLKTGKITIYSSKPLDKNTAQFVTPSKMNAEDYSGGEKIFSKTVDIDDVAWINGDEGQLVGKTYVKTEPKAKNGELKLLKKHLGTNYAVFSPDQIKTKSQLEQIIKDKWKAKTATPAKTTDPLVAEARKYKSADEFAINLSINDEIQIAKERGRHQIEKYKENNREDLIDDEGNITLYHGGRLKGDSIKVKKDEPVYFTPDYDEAMEYVEKNGGKVFEMKTKPEFVNYNTGSNEWEVWDSMYKVTDPDSMEEIYIPKITKSQLTDIWNKANKK